MHDALKVIAKSKSVGLSWLKLTKLVLKTIFNIIVDYINISVPVWSSVFMIEANGVAKLMNYNSTIDTARSQRYSLRLIPPGQPSNKRITPASIHVDRQRRCAFMEMANSYSTDLPIVTHYVYAVGVTLPFRPETYASVVMPVLYGSFNHLSLSACIEDQQIPIVFHNM